MIAYLSLEAHLTKEKSIKNKNWIIYQLKDIWENYQKVFQSLWKEETKKGDFFFNSLNTENEKIYFEKFFQEIFEDSIRFAGISILRR